MKRYKNTYDINVEDTSGEWVDADIAQGLYDALILIENDEGSSLSGIAWDRLQQALAKADGENT